MTSLLNFMKIYQLDQKLLVGDKQMDRQHGDFISLTFVFYVKQAKQKFLKRIKLFFLALFNSKVGISCSG
jgi:hypothetical protein